MLDYDRSLVYDRIGLAPTAISTVVALGNEGAPRNSLMCTRTRLYSLVDDADWKNLCLEALSGN